MVPKIDVKTYDTLLKRINEELEKAKTAAQVTLDNIKVVAYFNIGKFIKTHLDFKKYVQTESNTLVENVAAAVGMSARTVYRIVQFYECYAKSLSTPWTNFSWSHIGLLLRVKDPEKRLFYEQKLIEKHLSVVALEDLLKKDHIIAYTNREQRVVLSESRGLLHFYNLKQVGPAGSLCIDCGFKIYKELPAGSNYEAEKIVEIIENNGIYNIQQNVDNIPANLYNYIAYVKEIIDGDTLWLDVMLGFGLYACLKMRLRGVNAEDIASQSGIRSRDYVAHSLAGCEFVFIKSHSRDKFNRYLVDVYYEPGVTDSTALVKGGRFLNQELLDKGLAVKYRE